MLVYVYASWLYMLYYSYVVTDSLFIVAYLSAIILTSSIDLFLTTTHCGHCCLILALISTVIVLLWLPCPHSAFIAPFWLISPYVGYYYVWPLLKIISANFMASMPLFLYMKFIFQYQFACRNLALSLHSFIMKHGFHHWLICWTWDGSNNSLLKFYLSVLFGCWPLNYHMSSLSWVASLIFIITSPVIAWVLEFYPFMHAFNCLPSLTSLSCVELYIYTKNWSFELSG